jgi:hypothetical protein
MGPWYRPALVAGLVVTSVIGAADDQGYPGGEVEGLLRGVFRLRGGGPRCGRNGFHEEEWQ